MCDVAEVPCITRGVYRLASLFHAVSVCTEVSERAGRESEEKWAEAQQETGRWAVRR